MKTLLIIFLFIPVLAQAQSSTLIEKYPEMDTLKTIDEAPVMASSNPDAAIRKTLKVGTTVYGVKLQRGYFVTVDENGEFLGFIDAALVQNLSKVPLTESYAAPVDIAPFENKEQEGDDMKALIAELKATREEEKRRDENKSINRGLQTVALYLIAAGVIWYASTFQKMYDKTYPNN